MKLNKFALGLSILLGASVLFGCSKKEEPNKPNPNPPIDEGGDEEDKHLDVLFLGNSLMFFNDMPKMFEQMATIAGKDIYVDSVTQGSATMSLFADPGTTMGHQARLKISEKDWDYIVIEPSRRATPWEDTVYQAELAAAEELYYLADEIGAKLLIYSVWGNNTGNLDIYTQNGTSTSSKTGNKAISRKQHTKFMHDFSKEVCELVDGIVVEAGYAFENALAADQSCDLYYSDDKHPSLAGSYLAGLTFFGTIYKETNAYMSFDKGLKNADFLKEIANKTCLENLVPDLEDKEDETPSGGTAYNLLCVGSNYMENYSVKKMFTQLAKDADNIDVNLEWVLDGAYTNKLASNASTSCGATLKEKATGETKWDSVMFQITRRITKSSTDVETSEHNALKNIISTYFSGEDAPETYIYTMQSADRPSIFKDEGSNYTKTSQNETYLAQEGTDYFEELATDKWSDCGDPVLYGSAILDYNSTYSVSASNAEMGYMKACCFYNSLFKKAIPTNCTYYYNLEETSALRIREIAANWCL